MAERYLTDDQVKTIVERLRGQCALDLEQVAVEEGLEYYKITLADNDAIDDEVFLCEECGWWCGIEESADTDDDKLICDECGEKDDDC